MPFDAAGPIAAADRIEAIDAVRGIALFGVLIINLITEFRVSIFAQFLLQRPPQSSFDRILEDLLMLVLSQKALSLFSLLFGVSLAIQFERLAGTPNRSTLLVRRLAVLLAIGLVHLCLIWNGDILVEYALAGFVVLPFLFVPQQLLLAASAMFFGAYFILPYLPGFPAFPSQNWIAAHVAEANDVYANGSFADVLAFRLREIPAIADLHMRIFARTIALFLLGAYAWRTGVLREPEAHRRLLVSLAAAALLVGAGLSAIELASADIAPSLRPWLRTVERLTPIVLAVGYGAGVIAAFAAGAGKLFAWAAPLGRMAFTNYLLQSVILGWIFYGYGLGLFGSLSVSSGFALGVALYALQVVFSAWWLRYFRFGPVEWLWRTLMYGRLQPMRSLSSEFAK